MVPFYVVLQYVFPKRKEAATPAGAIKGFITTWVKSIGIAVSAALLGAVGGYWPNCLVAVSMASRRPDRNRHSTGRGWLIDKRNRLRGAMIAAVATLPRIVVSESWVRDKSSDEEFDKEMNTARDRLYAVLNDAS